MVEALARECDNGGEGVEWVEGLGDSPIIPGAMLPEAETKLATVIRYLLEYEGISTNSDEDDEAYLAV
jgi:hypothetical protein